MQFLRTPLGTAMTTVALILAVLLGVAVVQVDRATRPPRHEAATIDFQSMMIEVEEVRFPTVDGLALSGWLLRGRRDYPVILLGHDHGASKSSLVHLAVALGKEGFNLLLFDFRAHGSSEGGRSTLGLHEKRDVLAAANFAATLDGVALDRMGVYGAGMGAHAAALAALDRPVLSVIVLDGVYPDVAYPLSRSVYSNWGFGNRRLAFVPAGIFALLNHTSAYGPRAADAVTHLVGRDVLLLAPAGDGALTREMKAMYEGIPEQADADGNLAIMPAIQREGLFGDNLVGYHERVADFFRTRLLGS